MSHAVEARDLSVSFGRTVALAASDFTIPIGGVTAIIGPNGSGKSTMLNLIAGLIEPSAGTIEVNIPSARISYVMQATKVNETLPVTVREVVAMGRYASLGAYSRMRSEDRAIIHAALVRMGIADIESRHLHDLSGGQRQRVFVAQGLAQDHEMLLLDEPLTGIDLTTAHAIDDVIHAETHRGCTVVMTTHDLSEARSADFALLLSGRVVAAGAPEEALSDDNLVAAYGPSLLHVEKGRVFIDDPAHTPVPGRHAHRERSIHTESDRSGVHSDQG
ncbi:MAG: metal ABC transporter ATP-binding protein [Acidimicrobiia bacterium]|jgi:manganese transport system ATP-binding protein